jgi:hypothetical protein
MVVPYQIWMLQRIERAMKDAASDRPGIASTEPLLGRFASGHELLALSELLVDCRVEKRGARLFSALAPDPA